MNRKLIAAAVSAAVLPAVGYADSSFYARVNNAYDTNSLGTESTTDISGVASRFGFKGSTDIGNGLTAHGRYEFGTVTDKEGSGKSVRNADDDDSAFVKTSGLDTRLASAGVSGAFGRIDVGNQWSAYFNTFGTLVSPTFSLGYYLYSSVGGGPYRTSNTVKYSNTFGALTTQLDLRFNGSNDSSDTAEKVRGDGYGLGLSFAISDGVTLAAAIDSDESPDAASMAADSRQAFGIKANFGGFWGSIGLQTHENTDAAGVVKEITSNFLFIGGNVSSKTNWLVGYASADNGTPLDLGADNAAGGTGADADTPAKDDATQLTWGVYHNMGGGLRLYYEAISLSNEVGGHDGARHLLGMRVDF